MNYQPRVSDEERKLILDVLERERRELHPEVRRSTMNVDAHDDLQHRLQLVNDLIDKLRSAPVC